MSQIINLTPANFKVTVLDSSLPVLVDFWAPWCGPWQTMAPVLEELSSELDGKLNITKPDTDVPENQQLAIDYAIQSIPNLKLLKDGKVVKEFIGFRPKEALLSDLKQFI